MSEGARELLQEGERFHGFVVKKCLGEGGAASVYLVRHEVLDALYALKVLDPSVAEMDPSYVKRFVREARIATRIKHPNLVSVHDCGHDDAKDLYYLVMDYAPGTSLRDILAFEGRMTAERAADVVFQVASALDAAKPFGVVHRDIKPENIIVGSDGRVKLLDLGIAKANNLGDSLSTNTDSIFGTPSYISPEQAQSSADVDVRADIYSLGIVFFEMLTGRCPYAGENPARILEMILSDDEVPDVRDVAGDVPLGLAVLVRRMTIKDRSRRIAAFGDVLKELGRLGFGQDAQPSPEAEYPVPPPSEGMKTILSGLSGTPRTDVDPLARPDDDVRAFLEEKTRRRAMARLLNRLLAAIAIAAAIAVAVCLVLWH